MATSNSANQIVFQVVHYLIFILLLSCMSCNLDISSFCNFGNDSSCVNPAVDTGGKNSELAVLMRKMKEQTFLLREEITKRSVQSQFPDEFEKIYTAVPTDSAVKGVLFNAHSTLYLSALKEIYHSPDTLVIHQYNRMVNTCVNCHKKFCPGPIKLIKKMAI